MQLDQTSTKTNARLESGMEGVTSVRTEMRLYEECKVLLYI